MPPARVDAMDDAAQDGEPQPAPAAPTPAQTDAELSRIAREAVHQAPDPRLDKQLERMGLLDAADSPEPASARATAGADAGAEVERLREELRRSRANVWMLVAACAVLAIAVVVLLIR
jgi:hypothetical protein